MLHCHQTSLKQKHLSTITYFTQRYFQSNSNDTIELRHQRPKNRFNLNSTLIFFLSIFFRKHSTFNIQLKHFSFNILLNPNLRNDCVHLLRVWWRRPPPRNSFSFSKCRDSRQSANNFRIRRCGDFRRKWLRLRPRPTPRCPKPSSAWWRCPTSWRTCWGRSFFKQMSILNRMLYN